MMNVFQFGSRMSLGQSIPRAGSRGGPRGQTLGASRLISNMVASARRRTTHAGVAMFLVSTGLTPVTMAQANDGVHSPSISPPEASRTRTPSSRTDDMAEGFRNPPNAARPYVWWHWMNGNVTAEGARLDLEWMKRAGIGGAHVFEGNLVTPQIVAKRIVWMSPEWKLALRESSATAKRLDMDLGIATSPGWSITGAPFVAPEDAMKKFVWSEFRLEGGRHYWVQLPQPPSIAGPFQDVDGGTKIAPFYRDTAVLAVPNNGEGVPAPVKTTSSAGTLDAKLLQDGKFGPSLSLPFDANHPKAWILQDFGRPVTMRSAIIGLPGGRGFGAAPSPTATLEASDDGNDFRAVTILPPGTSQSRSAAFQPVTARYFRLGLTADPERSQDGPPGIVPLSLSPPPPAAFAISEFQLCREGRVSRAEEKAGFAAAADYYAIATPASDVNAAAPVRAGQVIDVTSHMAADGTLDWAAPPGRWTVLRLGYSLTGHQNGPAPAEATGLEVDKLDAGAVRRYAVTYLDKYRDALPVGQSPSALLSDSIEAGAQNWTPNLVAEFHKLRGYDPTPWLPVLTGLVIDSVSRSDKFLWDFRQTISELLARNHYGTLAAVAKEHGLTYYAEALEDHRPQLGDDLTMRSPADVPMGAMWTIPDGGKPRATFIADLQGAASVAHVYGKPLVAAESFTAFGSPWGFAPQDLKATADAEFALGVNRIMIHTSPHQPLTDAKPGMSLAPLLGQYFSRNETWEAMARGWTDYLARSSYLLQQGKPSADIAYFAGEEAPITGLYGDDPVVVPAGHGFDFISADALRDAVSVATDGTIVTTGGARYALIMLGGSSRMMTLRTVTRLRDLARAGATIAGPAPEASPSLADDPVAFRAIVDELWGRNASRSVHVFADVGTALDARSQPRDWQIDGIDDSAVAVLKRQLDDGALWFVSNRSGARITGALSLRIAGYASEFWSADSGDIRPSTYHVVNGRTVVPIDLAKDAAVFVVMRHRSAVPSRTIASGRTHAVAELEGGWRVSFPAQGDMAAFQKVGPLGSWSGAGKPTRYFSGTGTYTHDILVKRDWKAKGRRLFLKLGDVREIAEVRVNGRTAGVAWKPPFTVEVTDALKTGRNRIEIAVANLWVNRLIGDAQPGASKVTVTNGPSYTSDAHVKSSGLLGPVTLVAEDDR